MPSAHGEIAAAGLAPARWSARGLDQELAGLARYGDALAAARSTADFWQRLVEALGEASGAGRVAVLLPGVSDRRFITLASRGFRRSSTGEPLAEEDFPAAVVLDAWPTVLGRPNRLLELSPPATSAAASAAWWLGALHTADGPGCLLLLGFAKELEQDELREARLGLLVAQADAARHRLVLAGSDRASRRRDRISEEVGAALLACHTQSELAVAMHGLIEQLFPGANARLYLVRPGTRLLQPVLETPSQPGATVEQVPLDAAHPVADGIRRGQALFLRSAQEVQARYSGNGVPSHVAGAQALAAIPLGYGERGVAGFQVAFDRPQLFTDDDERLLLRIGRHWVRALERVRMLEAERMVEGVVERFHAIAEGLVDAVMPSQLASVVIDGVTQALAASAGAVVLHQDPDGMPAILASRGYSSGLLATLPRAGCPTPESDAVARRTAIAFRDLAEATAAYPHLRSTFEQRGQAFVALPLLVGDRVLGVLELSFAEPRTLAPVERILAATCATQCAGALDRALLTDREASGRGRIERLQRLSVELAGAADIDQVADAVIAHACDALGATACALVLADEDQTSLSIVRDTGYPPGAIDHLYPGIAVEADVPIAEAYRTNRPVLLGSLTEAEERFPDVVRVYRATGQAAAALPFSVGSRRLGGTVLVFPTQETFDLERRAEFETFARLCTQALDRARAFESEQRALDRSRRLQALSAALSRSATPREVGEAFLEHALPALSVDAGGLVLVDEEGRLRLVAVRGWSDAAASAIDGATLGSPFGIAEAVRRNRPVVIADRQDWRRRYPQVEPLFEGFQSGCAMPLRSADGAIGALGVTARREGALGRDELELYETLSELVVQALARARMYESERQSRARAEANERRIRFLADATSALEEGTDIAVRAAQLLEICVPAVADYGSIEVVRPDDRLEIIGSRHRDPELDPAWRRLRESEGLIPGGLLPLADVIRTGLSRLVRDLPAADAASGPAESEPRLRPISYMVVSLVVRGAPVGALVLCSSSSGRRFGDEDLELAEELARRTSLVLENTRLYDAQRWIARTLQLGLLSGAGLRTPAVTSAVRYQSGSRELEIGGDWHDVFELPDGRIGAVAGDVVGRGLTAAVTMAKLRLGLRSLALVAPEPGEMLQLLDAVASRTDRAPMTTLTYALLDPGSGRLSLASAGHPPPLVVDARGRATFIDDGRSAPLAGPGGDRPHVETLLEPGDTLVLYTDGLVERRRESLRVGLARLQRVASMASQSADTLQSFADMILRELERPADETGAAPQDDIALVCVRLEPHPDRVLARRVPASAEQLKGIRHELRAWLQAHSVARNDVSDVLLAVGEACTNAVEHAYGGAGEGELAVEARLENDGVTIVVRDFGAWQRPAVKGDRGRGLSLIEASVDRVERHTSATGTSLTMKKRLGRRPAAAAP